MISFNAQKVVVKFRDELEDYERHIKEIDETLAGLRKNAKNRQEIERRRESACSQISMIKQRLEAAEVLARNIDIVEEVDNQIRELVHRRDHALRGSIEYHTWQLVLSQAKVITRDEDKT